jgi:inner membrane protein involved in colicin E2 resistance
MAKRVAAIVLIYFLVFVAWMVLAGVTNSRSTKAETQLESEVAGLWGAPQTQPAPSLVFRWSERVLREEEVTNPKTGQTTLVKKSELVWHSEPMLLDSSDIRVDFDLSHRKKGLLWYATYQVDFAGDYTLTYRGARTGWVDITYAFPSDRATLDDFSFVVDGKQDENMTPVGGGKSKVITQRMPIQPGQDVAFTIAYSSRGLNHWRYELGRNISRIKNFSLTMHTNFDAIDFSTGSMSPSEKMKTDQGWQLVWQFSNLMSGFDIAMDMPHKLNPGPLAAQISYFAPLSLLYFFIWMFVITLLKKIDLHPMNYLFLSAAFFAFHLLLTYTADHLDLLPAFLLSSAVSIGLVLSYMRLVVGARFAAVEVGLAQLVYLVFFSYAHFYKGWTGLIVTVGSIATLFVMMQLTGRIDWSEKFAPIPTARPVPPPRRP